MQPSNRVKAKPAKPSCVVTMYDSLDAPEELPPSSMFSRREMSRSYRLVRRKIATLQERAATLPRIGKPDHLYASRILEKPAELSCSCFFRCTLNLQAETKECGH